jgi:hypothetical protein
MALFEPNPAFVLMDCIGFRTELRANLIPKNTAAKQAFNSMTYNDGFSSGRIFRV